MAKEVWKDIIGYENLYQISNFGNVKSLEKRQLMPNNNSLKISQEKLLKQFKNNKNYLYVALSKNNIVKKYTVHRLVALHFIPNQKKLSCVCHKDNNTINNIFTNLIWGNVQDNMNMKVKDNRQCKGSQISQKLTENDVISIRQMYNKKDCNQYKLATLYNVSQSVINEIINYKTWKHV